MALEHMFKPLRLGPTVIPNRFVSASHQTTLVADHLPTDDFIAYQEARARGGTGLIVIEAVAADRSGLLTGHTIAGFEEGIVASYRDLVSAVEPHGTRLFAQLFHGGRELLAGSPRPATVSSSATPSARYHTEPRGLRTDEIEDLIDSYRRSASFAARGGLHGIEISASHGYLIEQFLDPSINRRQDRFGEPEQFALELIAAVREAAPDLTVGVRLSADSEPARRAVARISPEVDYIHIAIGNSSTFDGCIDIVPPPPSPRNAIAGLTGEFRVGPPLIATTRIVDPRDAGRIVGNGEADAVGMTRALITDPDMPEKTRRGEFDTVLRCIGCNVCIEHYHAETPIRCAQNPRTGRERTWPVPGKSRDPKTVVVIGAGPAGLAAATEAADRGHRVTVFERRPDIGGQLRVARAAPARQEMFTSLTANYARLRDRPEVSLFLGTEADIDSIVSREPDAVILASGAKPFQPALDLDGVNVLHAWEVLEGARPSGRVIVADWGGDPSGLDCAELLASTGHEVTLAVGAMVPGEALHQYQRNGYIARLLRAGVRIEHYLGLESATDGSVHFRNVVAPELTTDIETDTLVLAQGRVPVDELTEELLRCSIALHQAGDCRSPRGLEEAILEGSRAGQAFSA